MAAGEGFQGSFDGVVGVAGVDAAGVGAIVGSEAGEGSVAAVETVIFWRTLSALAQQRGQARRRCADQARDLGGELSWASSILGPGLQIWTWDSSLLIPWCWVTHCKQRREKKTRGFMFDVDLEMEGFLCSPHLPSGFFFTRGLLLGLVSCGTTWGVNLVSTWCDPTGWCAGLGKGGSVLGRDAAPRLGGGLL